MVHAIFKAHLDGIISTCKRHRVKSAWAFGSVTSDDFNDESDVDLLIAFDEIPFDGYADNFFELEEELKDLLQREVDLVPLHTLSNPYFIESVNRSKVLLYE